MSTQGCQKPIPQGRIVLGLVVIVLGLMLLLDRTGAIALHTSWRLWPFALLAMGLARLTDSNGSIHACRGSYASGAWLLLVGAWGLVSEFRLFGFDYRTSWPLLMIAVGLMIVWRSLPTGRNDAQAGDRGSTP
jgi:hypothetical protein